MWLFPKDGQNIDKGKKYIHCEYMYVDNSKRNTVGSSTVQCNFANNIGCYFRNMETS